MAGTLMAGVAAALLLMGADALAQDRETDRRASERPVTDRPGTDRPGATTPSVDRRDEVARIAGEWSGTYVCVQGATAMRLVVAPIGGREVRAVMHFFATPDNSSVPEGCFTLTGALDPGGEITLHQERWIMQPPGYLMIDFDGEVDRDGRQFRGSVIGPTAGCTRFRLTRDQASRPLPEACTAQAR